MKNFKSFDEFISESVNEAKVTTIKISDLDLDKHGIKGKIKIQSPFTADASELLDKKSDVDEWIKVITQKFGKQGTIEIDPTQAWFNVFKIVGNKKLDKWKGSSTSAKSDMLNAWGTSN